MCRERVLCFVQVHANVEPVSNKKFRFTRNTVSVAPGDSIIQRIWKFGDKLNVWHSTSRGVAYWTDGTEKRILHTMGSFLYCIDAKTGKSISTFGDNGKVDLHDGLPSVAKDKFIISNTPGTVFEDLIVMPLRVSEGADAAPGDIRAFNVKTGKLAWIFHTIPYPGEAGYETFPPHAYKNEEVGAANNWAGMAVDKKRGILYAPKR